MLSWWTRGQDLLTEPNVDVLDLAVGGLRRGRWKMFGDFAHQRIFGGDFTLENFQERYGLVGVAHYYDQLLEYAAHREESRVPGASRPGILQVLAP